MTDKKLTPEQSQDDAVSDANIARRRLLLRGGAVAQAAELAGYSAASNFATAFRQHYGVSPSRARG